jgi:hypothetical protein
LRQELERAGAAHEEGAAQMRRRQQEAVAEMAAQLDSLLKAKAR